MCLLKLKKSLNIKYNYYSYIIQSKKLAKSKIVEIYVGMCTNKTMYYTLRTLIVF